MGHDPGNHLQERFYNSTGYPNVHHSAWEGLTFYDLIFPLFLFIVGVSVPFSIHKIIQQKGKLAAVRRVAARSLLLFGLGVIYYGGFSNFFNGIRLWGVLQRIALCYLVASLLFIFLTRARRRESARHCC